MMEHEDGNGPFHDIATLLPAYLNAALSDEERHEVETHLATCAICRQELEEFRKLHQAITLVRATNPDPVPDLFQNVRARLEAEAVTETLSPARAPAAKTLWWKRVTSWLQPLYARPWAPALATMLIVVQLVLIAGLAGYALFGSTIPPSADRNVPEGLAAFQAARFQDNLQSPQELGALVAAHSPPQQQSLTYGFGPSPAAIRALRLGTMYAETLAYLHSDNSEEATQRIKAMLRELEALPIPSSSPLLSHLQTGQILLESPHYDATVVRQYLTTFQPLYETAAPRLGAEMLAMFRIGAWLVDMSLAAAAGDTSLLRQERNVQYLQQELQQADAPDGALKALDELGQLVAEPELSDRNVQRILKLLRKIQEVLMS